MIALLVALSSMAAPAQLDRLVDVAATACHGAVSNPDRVMLRAVLAEEIAAGWPDALRGAILAAACRESGYNRRARGDCKVEKGRKNCRAVGLLQLWPWAKIDREDPIASARVWSRQIARTVGKARRKGCSRPWITAWNWVATGPRGWRCNRVPRHVRTMRRFHRLWRLKKQTD